MVGVVLIVLGMVIVLPVALFLVGAVWSALLGWTLADDADERAEGQPA
ncbi:MAG: hypothetical protein JOZ99_09470 [Actinobacteria bacterium]|nr:hypothetical protein [Actinomycetota bacterium]